MPNRTRQLLLRHPSAATDLSSLGDYFTTSTLMPEILEKNHGKGPIFVVASWLLPCVVWLIAAFVMTLAKAAGKLSGGFISGLTEAIVSLSIVAFCAFSCGLAAILRRERYRWLAFPPLLAGLCILILISWMLLTL